MVLALCAAAIRRRLVACRTAMFSLCATAIFLALFHAFFHILPATTGLGIRHLLAVAAGLAVFCLTPILAAAAG